MNDVLTLSLAAVSVAFVHTLCGPDHYLPFVALSKAGGWSRVTTCAVTAACGLGHVLGSVLLGIIGIALGFAASDLLPFENGRGNLVAWGLIAFGLCYGTWGGIRAYRSRPHTHNHAHAGGDVHVHGHSHHDEHLHLHEAKPTRAAWWLFVIFILGPCEPLIPLLMYPASQKSWGAVGCVTLLFAAVTILTMVGVVLLASLGISRLAFPVMQRCSHAITGLILAACGAAILVGF